MRILAIDYGEKKIGLAVADTESRLAEPHSVIRFDNEEEAIGKVKKVIGKMQGERVEQVVVGISEGKMAQETKDFVRKLRKKARLPIIFQDETLTTKEAEKLAIKAGIKRKKRRELSDAYSATLILQSYLDSH